MKYYRSIITALAFAATSVGFYAEADEDPYFRLDPGPGQLPITVTQPTNAWTPRSPLDNRVPANFAGGTFQMIPYPFADSAGQGDVLRINYVHNGTSVFGGISMQSPLSPAVTVPAGSTIEFDVYYPKSAQGIFMRWRVRNTFSNLDSYLRDYQYNNLNPDWVGSYNSETWLKAHHSINASTGLSSNFVLELHGETSRPAETGTLLVANIKITAPDPDGIPLPNVVNAEHQSVVAPLKSLYNPENGLFMVGAIGTGPVTGTRARHYEIFVDGNNLKAEGTHPRGPNWLTSATGAPLNGATTTPGVGEFNFPTNSYLAIRDSGTPGQYKAHAHVLAWYNQAPAWMRQIVPANLPSGYNGTTDFYGLGNGVTTQVRVEKEMARRVQFNHTMYVMRHFLSTDAKYGSSESRGVIPFNSWDVLNEEIHESRHSELIPTDINNWRTSLKHTNWLAAMSDDLIGDDIAEHYIYLLFKHAHIAAPNARMAAAYKANYADLPEYMKLDGHDAEGSIDAYIVDSPPKLTYNDYGIGTRSKARTVYNMIRDLNIAWLSDPLFDGRPLIEDAGIQGHDSVGRTLASDNQYAIALYATLVDQGLLSGISYSELDLKMPTSAPGGGATAPAALNVRQSDALGYQYALMYKLFTKFAPYIDHIISWGVSGSGWQGSYVLFDQQSNANAGYYGAMDPDRFILGHSYLDPYFEGEYEKLEDDYEIDLGDLGIYTGEPPLVYSIEDTSKGHVAPEFPDFDHLPIVRPLPDAFRSFDGSRDTSMEGWRKRRHEVKSAIEKYEIGRKPDASGLSITASYTPPAPGTNTGRLIVNVVRDSNGKSVTLNSTVFIPPGWEDYGQMPALIPMTWFRFNPGANYGSLPSVAFAGKPIATVDFNHDQVTRYFLFGPGDYGDDPFYQMYPEFVPAGRANSDSGQYAAWSWGISRLIDGMEIASRQAVNPLPIDTRRLAVTGCSYAGKMALFAGAFDERIALTIPQESGGGGAPAWRVSNEIEGNRVVESLSHTDRKWFASQLFQFSYNNVYKLPYDHHELMAMVAPRALLETGNASQLWLSDRANYVAARATQKVYETLGIGDRFGFYLDTGHGHCATLPEQAPAVASFVDKYLLGFDDIVTNIHVNTHPNLDYKRWTDWWGTDNPEFSRDWNPGDGTVVMSEEIDLQVGAGANVQAGYGVSIPGPHGAADVMVAGSDVQLDIVADDGRSYTLTVPFADDIYSIPAIDNSWYPSANPNDASAYQGSTTAGGFTGQVERIYFRALGVNNGGAGNAAGPALVADTGDPVNVRFHVASNGAGGAWSDVATVRSMEEPVMGDVNGDDAINAADLQAMQRLMRKRAGDTGWIPQADIDGDGVITLYDYRRLLAMM